MSRSTKRLFLCLGLMCFVLFASSCELTWTHGDVDTSQGFISDVRYDDQGRAHVLYYNTLDKDETVTYATCAGQCEDPHNWAHVVLHEEGKPRTASLAVGPSGSVHVVFSLPYMAVETDVYYTYCREDCGRPESWPAPVSVRFPRGTVRPESNFALVLDENEHPRGIIAGYDLDTREYYVDYVFCDGRCLEPESWLSTRIVRYPDAPWVQDIFDHSIDRNESAYVVTYGYSRFSPPNYVLPSRFCLHDCRDPSNWEDGPTLPIGNCGGQGLETYCYQWSPVKIRPDGSASFVGTKVDWSTGVPVTTLEYRSYADPQGTEFDAVEIAQDIMSTSLTFNVPRNPEAAPKPRIAGLSRQGLAYISCDNKCDQASSWRIELIDTQTVWSDAPQRWPRIALNNANLPGIVYKAIDVAEQEVLRYAFGSNVSAPWSPATTAAAGLHGRATSELGVKICYLLMVIVPSAAVLISIAARKDRRS